MTSPGRNRFHSLCPYFAMFPESFAEAWINRLTRPGDVVLDPFCGRGTAPFQAILMQRHSIGVDVNPVAYCVSTAKTSPPALSSLRRRITVLERGYHWRTWEAPRRKLPEFFFHAYTPRVLKQLLYLREQLRWKEKRTDCMIAALVLGSLHGESARSERYLSNQMPHTISTKPAYSIKFWQQHGHTPPDRDVFALVREMAAYRYDSKVPKGIAAVYQNDVRQLPWLVGAKRTKLRCVITSPPYFDVTNFEEDQWLRLWFLGGPPRPTQGRVSSDDRHGDAAKYWSFIGDMWRALGQVLAPRSNIVIRFGATRLEPDQMRKMLQYSSRFSGRNTQLVSHELSTIKGRQTQAFRPGAKGCRIELDCHFQMA